MSCIWIFSYENVNSRHVTFHRVQQGTRACNMNTDGHISLEEGPKSLAPPPLFLEPINLSVHIRYCTVAQKNPNRAIEAIFLFLTQT